MKYLHTSQNSSKIVVTMRVLNEIVMALVRFVILAWGHRKSALCMHSSTLYNVQCTMAIHICPLKPFLYLTEGCSIKVLVIGNGEEGRGCRLTLRTVELCREGVWNCGTVRCASSLGSHQLATEGGGRDTSPALGYLKLLR